jgi:hypothetical protein
MNLKETIRWIETHAPEIIHADQDGNIDAAAIVSAYGMYLRSPDPGSAGIMIAATESFKRGLSKPEGEPD